MSDGVRLSARIWRPRTEGPVPALLEYLPYRKGDWTAPRDAQRHPWYAAHGYASVRVDLRGSGDSGGVMRDEYSAQELSDAVEVIGWLAEQDWCDGNVGMFGVSWGGFNALQVAALRPAPLKAIVTVCSSDDRFNDDVHYFGGAVLGVDMLAWATTMLAFTARPPDPTRIGPAWREMWQQRLDALEPYLDTWLAHQERDDYWRHGSVSEDYSAITAAVLAVGGWADPYRGTVLRLVENLSAPVKGIIGPWSHQYPDIDGEPGPSIGFLQETLRWWDRYLRGVDTGVDSDPALRVYLQDGVAPATRYAIRSGRWLAEPSWPSPHVRSRRWALRDLTCSAAVGVDRIPIATPQHCGIDAGRYFPIGNPSDLPPDQREEDGRSVCFDTGPLDEPFALLGVPTAVLHVHADEPASLAVRLCDVAPDGASTLVTRGVLDLRHRDGMDRTVDVAAGSEFDVTVSMVAMGYEFAPGHRIRLSLSTAYWPWVFPYPRAAAISIEPGRSALDLPVRDAAPADPTIEFAPSEQAEALAVITHPAAPGTERSVDYNPQTREWRLTVDPDYGGSRTFPDGLEYRERVSESYSIRSDDPSSARCASRWQISMRRPGWEVDLAVQASMWSEGECFVTHHEVEATLDGVQVFRRGWDRRIPRVVPTDGQGALG
ncbi:MAG: CocE/NonD family hydrolase [Jatrophihabitans sp.]